MNLDAYKKLFNVHVTDINRNSDAITSNNAEIADLETRLAIAKARDKALRAERRRWFNQLKGVRAIIRTIEDDQRTEERQAEDEATE